MPGTGPRYAPGNNFAALRDEIAQGRVIFMGYGQILVSAEPAYFAFLINILT